MIAGIHKSHQREPPEVLVHVQHLVQLFETRIRVAGHRDVRDVVVLRARQRVRDVRAGTVHSRVPVTKVTNKTQRHTNRPYGD